MLNITSKVKEKLKNKLLFFHVPVYLAREHLVLVLVGTCHRVPLHRLYKRSAARWFPMAYVSPRVDVNNGKGDGALPSFRTGPRSLG